MVAMTSQLHRAAERPFCVCQLLHFFQLLSNPSIDLELEYIFGKPMKCRFQRCIVCTQILSTFHARVAYISVTKYAIQTIGLIGENDPKIHPFLWHVDPHTWILEVTPLTTLTVVHQHVCNRTKLWPMGESILRKWTPCRATKLMTSQSLCRQLSTPTLTAISRKLWDCWRRRDNNNTSTKKRHMQWENEMNLVVFGRRDGWSESWALQLFGRRRTRCLSSCHRAQLGRSERHTRHRAAARQRGLSRNYTAWTNH